MTKKPLVVKCSTFFSSDSQWCRLGSRHWKVSGLFVSAKNLPVQEAPLAAINMSDFYDMLTLKQFVGHMKSVLAADLKYPIILSANGEVMDGRHRIMKALLEGRPTIKFVRFDRDPVPDREGD